ncbi:hypothetical protein [Pantoea ananatis]|uniref:hypothetical protein n=1 Tax=Pantoea ananas TaxID=553 RepID=UPI0019809F8F|nr:hypothetical protein [Pantoea ananatis]MBN6030077.1 hypothetical protein [Pantoea ananatis]
MMKHIVNRLSFYIMAPILIQMMLFLLCFNITAEMFLYSLLYLGSLFFLVVFFELIFRKKFDIEALFDNVYSSVNSIDRLVLKTLGLLIILLFPLDVYFNGFKLLNPASYAEFYGAGRYVRHITSMCWMLVPVAYLIQRKNPWLARFFIFSAMILPVLMIDRNRLLMSFFCYFFILYARFKSVSVRKRKAEFRRVKIGIYSLLLLLPFAFAMLGFYRSGSSFAIESSGSAIVYGKFPLTDFFGIMPPAIKQILLYITTPILNFTHVAATGFHNDQFLLSQISPFSRDDYPAYPFSPVLIARYNVGTEFYPFLLYSGLSMVFLAMFIVVLTYAAIFHWFCKSQGFFSWLLFLKMTYLMIFLGFAPQFFILLNVMSTIMIFLIYFFSEFLKLCLIGKTKKYSARQ